MRKPFAVTLVALAAGVAPILAAAPTRAHGPLFSPAPETIFKGGTELTLGLHTEKATGASEHETAYEASVEAEYGLTADWEIGIEVPYARRDLDDGGGTAVGLGDLTLETKYQFWGRDLPGAQYKAAALLKLKLPSGEDARTPRLGSGSTDVIAGLATGYESRRWYWFASAVYRANTEGGGLEKGDRQFLNLVGGIRPVLTAYDEPDTVLMLELNWERSARDDLDGVALANTGGWELFVSPVIWWTYRQFAVRGGVQIPVAENLNGIQPSSDYRARVEFVYHF
ncbi:MAG: hypothetical protein D6826_08330 [Alphaproteobacteria bacterium]|nr:MAG: hypothetical protein D6826_08330 [Alphaproteobacteria bacterium]